MSEQDLNRRDFLAWMTALTALIGAEGCTRQPLESIVPYTRMPEELVPGKPLFYSTAMTQGGEAIGVLVESHLGRPTKVEGNELHPGSLGATNAFMQAAVLGLYDPDRSRALMRGTRVSTWQTFTLHLRRAIQKARESGQSVRILTPAVLSPTLSAELDRLPSIIGNAQWHSHDPINRDGAREGARLAFGAAMDTRYDFSKADVILSLDADFLSWMPGRLRYARQFTDRRHAEQMNRLYVIEATPSLTGAMADHRLPLRSVLIPAYTAAISRRLGVPGKSSPHSGIALSPAHVKWVEAMTRDLLAHRGRCLVVAGESQPAEAHALVQAVNEALGNFGTTVLHGEPIEKESRHHIESLKALVEAMRAGSVGALFVLGTNPVYTAPADLDFKAAMEKVPFRAHLGQYPDETAALSEWHIPEAHFLESWGDTRAYDGAVTIQQPLIQPLYGGKSAIEVVRAILGAPNDTAHDAVKDHWRKIRRGPDFEKQWRKWLHDGVIPETRTVKRPPAVLRALPEIPSFEISGLDLVFRPDPAAWDGEYGNNGWMQELPRPFTGLTWDNAALISPETLKRLHLVPGDVVELSVQGRKITAPVLELPGQPDDTVTVTLGYGRTAAGRLGTGRGFDAYPLRTLANPWFTSGLALRGTGGRATLATVHGHHSMEGRNLARSGDIDEYRRNPRFVKESPLEGPLFEPMLKPDPAAFPPAKNSGADYQWGMSINLNTCIGCNACVVACQAENNIPVVGKAEVLRGREMHWIRIDNYFKESAHAPRVHFQPVPCMHCETAPCEVVCPVEATVHSHEGLNQMVYNRCVGTRYCSNNCPYKVRRFNFFNYKDPLPLIHLADNPDVTVRERGVMEKCTYCVQRINAATINAEKEGRKVRDREFTTACAQACPTRAIVFGNLLDPAAQVTRLKAEPLDYALLQELNTRPRTTYLGKLWNSNPKLKGFA